MLVIYSSLSGFLACFHILTVNNAAMNISIQVLCGYVLISFRYIPSNGIALTVLRKEY